ncbi:MAG: hypothetical protein DHS20C14_05050 [Phycisphaeraceae bacterium]|nr:MAG: hypothetical protein DHS20C14_05050 [Phycisphaeraceae bacterium]
MGDESEHNLTSDGATPAAAPARPSQARELARELTGDLPCSRCGYNLRGLSIRSGCSECGLPVRTTILVLVDPRADELVPLSSPRLTAWGMIAWIGGALGCAAAVLALRMGDLLDAQFSVGLPMSDIAWAGLAMLGLSAVGSCVIVRPHASIPISRRVLTTIGVLLYVPLLALFHRIHLVVDMQDPMPYVNPGSLAGDRVVCRLAFAAVAVLLVLALRPGARHLAARSFIFRTGLIDRQSMYGIVAAFAVTLAGDGLRLAHVSGPRLSEYVSLGGITLIALGSFLLAVGIFAAFTDVLRLRRVLIYEGIGLAQILETNASRARRAGSDA